MLMTIALLAMATPSSLFVRSFSVSDTQLISSYHTSTCLRMSSTPFNHARRKNIRLPLLVDINDDDDGQPLYDVPLPNYHLPPELTTASLYELKLDIPLHRSVIQDAIGISSAKSSSDDSSCSYGHLVYKREDSIDLVGSIGCVSEILIGAPASSSAQNANERKLALQREDSGPLFVLARGSYRFRVKEIISSIPYPTAIVEEVFDEKLMDRNIDNKSYADDHDDDNDAYNTLSSKELVKQILQCLGKLLKDQVEATATPLSPLEQSILENAPSLTPMAQARQRKFDAEERLAVFQTFTISLLDLAPDETDRIYTVAMMAGELANLSSNVRVQMLVMTDGVARLRLVLRELSTILSMDSARRITKSLSLGGDANDGLNVKSLQVAEETQKQLQVGTPKLPPWASQIKKGVKVEYWWDDKEGWCLGTVCDDPIKIMDEMIVTVKFDADGSVHKLPLRGDDKARWRPPKGNTGTYD